MDTYSICTYIYIYMHTYLHIYGCGIYIESCGDLHLGLYTIFVYFEAVVHESTIFSFPPPTCIAHPGAIPMHDY